MKRLLDPTFRYKPSFETDVRKTFERVRREQRATARGKAAPDANVRLLRVPRS